MALSKLVIESFQEDLSCGICEGKLRDGQFLKCFHTFCKKCLQAKKDADSGSQRGMIANVASGVFRVATHMFTASEMSSDQEYKIPCPVCTKEGKPGDSHSRQYVFPNILADMKIDSIDFTEKIKGKAESEKVLSCESCQENDSKVTSYCVDCGQFICELCVAAHKKLSLTRSHTLMEIEDIQNGKALIDVKREKANPKCPVHPSCTISQLCTICQVAICSECRDSTERHHLHPSLELTEGLKPFLEESRVLVEKVGPERFDKIISDFLQHKKEIAETADQLKKQVNEDAQAACAEILKQVEDRRLAVMAKISRVEGESIKATNNLIKEMELLRVRANKTLSYVDILQRSGTNADILAARSGGFLDYLRDLGAEVNTKGSCKTNDTLKLHTKSFPFPRYQVKWYTPLYTE